MSCSMSGAELTPFLVDVPEAELEDLRVRLGRTRWAEPETVADWSQGVPVAYLRDLCEYWREDYDWRRTQARLNAIPQFRTEIDGVRIHFLHARSWMLSARWSTRRATAGVPLTRSTSSVPRCPATALVTSRTVPAGARAG